MFPLGSHKILQFKVFRPWQNWFRFTRVLIRGIKTLVQLEEASGVVGKVVSNQKGSNVHPQKKQAPGKGESFLETVIFRFQPLFGGCIFPIGSMNQWDWYILPTWIVDFYGFHVAKFIQHHFMVHEVNIAYMDLTGLN